MQEPRSSAVATVHSAARALSVHAQACDGVAALTPASACCRVSTGLATDRSTHVYAGTMYFCVLILCGK